MNELDKLVLSVAVPIRRFATLYGVLMLTTELGDIDDILKDERAALVKVFALAFGVLLLSSLYLAGTIAAPVRRLAAAAERVRRGRAGREAIPDIPDRGDEIGELAESLSAMTRALVRPHRCDRAVRRRRRARAEESDHLAQKRGRDARAHQGRRQPRAPGAGDPQRSEAHRPPDHRYLGCVAPGCGTVARTFAAGRCRAAAADAGHDLRRDGNAARRPCRGRARFGQGRHRARHGRAIWARCSAT